ncbi:MAG: BTAD domain-containing putative transcriptional regulator [Trueperaceae bacterium]|nr:BTAD domain-containing putative transcriptional regulator [Trueperaceae bacterium]
MRDLAEAHAERGDADAARRIAEQRARADLLDEPAAIDLIRRCAALGDRAAARRAFDAHADALQDELGADPSPAARAAVAAALAAPAAAPEGEPPPPPPRSLTTPGTPFVGRDRERALVSERSPIPPAGC